MSYAVAGVAAHLNQFSISVWRATPACCIAAAYKRTKLELPLIIALGSNLYTALAAGVLIVHVVFVLWVVAGALLTRSHPRLRWIHVASLVWGIVILVFPWSCPLTTLENWLESQAGVQPYQGGFLLHYLDALLYPNISSTVLVAVGIAVCGFNLAVYARRYWKAKSGAAAHHHR